MTDAKLLAQWLEQEEDQLKHLAERRERIDAEIAKAAQKSALIKNLIALQSPHHYTQQTMPPLRGRFNDGVAIRDAALTILREQKRATLDQIVEALKAGGYDFNGRSPRRVVFLTMTNLMRSKNGASPVGKDKNEYILVAKED